MPSNGRSGRRSSTISPRPTASRARLTGCSPSWRPSPKWSRPSTTRRCWRSGLRAGPHEDERVAQGVETLLDVEDAGVEQGRLVVAKRVDLVHDRQFNISDEALEIIHAMGVPAAPWATNHAQ